MTEHTHQGHRYAEYHRPRWPWPRLRWWVQRRRLRANPPTPQADGLDYTGWTVRIFGHDPDGVFPPDEHVGSVGFIAESDVQRDGERTHHLEFETMSCPGIHLPAAHFELIPPGDPLTGNALTLSTDELLARYGPLRANFRMTAENHVRYMIVTRDDEQNSENVTFPDLTHVDVPDPDGALLDAAAKARRAFNRHHINTNEPLLPAGPTVDELVNGYRRPAPDPADH